MYGEEELTELSEVIKNKSPFRHYGIGNPCKTEVFEKEVQEYFDVKYSLAVSSGTGALFCAMAALGVGPDDEVIIPSYSWFSNYYCVTNLGALPVFADIDESICLDPNDFERKITDKTKAVIVISYQGCPPKMDEIMRIAKVHNIKVVEDFAQAFGAS